MSLIAHRWLYNNDFNSLANQLGKGAFDFVCIKLIYLCFIILVL